MTTFHESFEETYNYLSSFYGLIKNDNNFSKLEILQLNKLSSFYFDFQENFRKTLNFNITIDFENKNTDYFIINDILKMSSGYITNSVIFDKRDACLVSFLDINGYISLSKEPRKVLETSCQFSIKNVYDFFIIEKKEINNDGLLDYHHEMTNNLEKHFTSILKHYRSEIENAYPLLRDTNIFFNDILNSTSTYVNAPSVSGVSRLTRDVVFKTTIDFSTVTSTHFTNKIHKKDEYKETIKEFADTLMLLHDVNISNKTKKTIFFKEKIKNRAPK